MSRTIWIVLLFGLMAGMLSPSASDARRRAKQSGVDFTAYMWPTARSGDVTIQGESVPIDNSIGDMMDFNTWAMVFHIEARKENWLGILDLNYQQGEEDDLEGNRTETTSWVVEAAVAYRVAYQFEVLGGLRFIDLKADVTEDSVPQLNASESWVDPFLGGRYNWPFAREWMLLVRGDVGGFGIGSDFTWNLVTGVDWRPGNLGFFFGYRVWSVDYSSGDGDSLFKYDVVRHGPALGVTFSFGGE